MQTQSLLSKFQGLLKGLRAAFRPALKAEFEVRHDILRREDTKGKRVIVIGDVHGCIDELNLLLEKLEYSKKNDIVVMCGDLVAKGPSSLECVRKARRFGFFSVIGNHDFYVAADNPKEENPHLEHKFLARNVLSQKDVAWLRKLPTTLTIEEYNTIVVHAGLDPKSSRVEETSLDNAIHMRSITSEGDITSDNPGDSSPWAQLWKGPATVVFGHDARRGLQQYECAVGIDTGCVYGRKLTAYVLPSREIIDVDAKTPYKPVK